MTLAPIDLAHCGALTDRAYLVLVARWRRARPRRDFAAWVEAEILAALARVYLACAACAAVTPHALAGEAEEPLLSRVTRSWRCARCQAVRLQVVRELEAEAA